MYTEKVEVTIPEWRLSCPDQLQYVMFIYQLCIWTITHYFVGIPTMIDYAT